ncbi:TetR/AcrR family transcriptional regulator [Rhodococcus sp. P1Y]|uniref:TetR/AcrR family transcriptional regulator n=1 Tax=Rhodococcus sp. P1Y TaxID=1302308 RepID=UPI000EB1280A|nr:TetR/AcrR family transcriptional regulator [Rhodococcus sp. P1Y]AYJ47113.1 TetR/AcrR family transcriptional regulator [Rhodococcus sp. P1Y]
MTQSTDAPERRTQAERTAGTQAKLLNAAIECLVELGFAKTSTQEIARRAGVSRGAQLHHFPTKEALVTAAVAHLVDRRLEEILATNPDPERGVEVLIEGFSGPLFYAALELWVAARTDPALHEAMVPLERRISEAIMGGATAIMGSRMSAESIELSVELARGLAVSALFRTPEADVELRNRLLPAWEAKVLEW